MKRVSFIAFLIGASIMLLSHTVHRPVKSNGIAGYTTATKNCSSCHGGAAGGSAILTSNIPANGFVPGTTYNMTLTVAEAGQPLFGMDLAAIGGTVVAGAGTKILSTEVVHTGGGSTSGIFSFTWIAPMTGNGTFNFSGLSTNNDGSENTQDHTYTGTKVFSPEAVTAGISATATATNVSCFGGTNATATVTASGGTTYSYLWSNGQTTQTATGLGAGTYTVTATSGTQTANASATVTQPTLLTGTISTPTVLTCAAPSTTITAGASGGTPPYTYSWSTTATTAAITATTAGSYTVTINDSKGCNSIKIATVTGSCVAVACSPTTVAPANVTIVNSTCSSGCSASGGSIKAPTAACPTGYTLQYSINGGAWYTTAPIYEQAGTGQSIRTRCSCDSDPLMMSPISTAVVTVPSVCANATTAPTLTITNNVLPSLVGTISATGCGAGTVVEYATVAAGPFIATAPIYTTSPITVFARCRNTTTNCTSTVVTGTTAPVAAGGTSVLTFNCPANITLTASSQSTSAIANYTAPKATSTCTTGSITVTKTSGLQSGSTFPIGVSTICYTAKDGCGSTKNCCFTIIVKANSNDEDDDDDKKKDKKKDKKEPEKKDKDNVVNNDQDHGSNVANLNQNVLNSRGNNQSVQSVLQQKNITLYPNPANDVVNLEVAAFNGQALTIQVVNQFGKIVKTQEIKEANADMIPISLHNVANGFYYITVYLTSEKVSKKFIVNKSY